MFINLMSAYVGIKQPERDNSPLFSDLQPHRGKGRQLRKLLMGAFPSVELGV